MASTKLGHYIEPIDIRNVDDQYGEEAVVGLSTQKQIIRTKADLDGVKLTSYKVFAPKTFAYVPDTSSISTGQNLTGMPDSILGDLLEKLSRGMKCAI